MGKIVKVFVLTMVAMLMVTNSASAQFWKKAKEAVQSAATTTTTESTESDANVEDQAVKTIAWDSIPSYEIKAFPVVNEDGTTSNRYYLVDQFGRKRSAEAVKAQQKAINKLVVTILAKTGVSAGLGALAGGGQGAAVGAVAGVAASTGDIVQATKLKKSLKAQKNLLQEYEKNFSAEGLPIEAKADLSNYTVDENSMTAEEVAELVNSDDFKNADESAFDF